jgi:hypothetical protein
LARNDDQARYMIGWYATNGTYQDFEDTFFGERNASSTVETLGIPVYLDEVEAASHGVRVIEIEFDEAPSTDMTPERLLGFRCDAHETADPAGFYNAVRHDLLDLGFGIIRVGETQDSPKSVVIIDTSLISRIDEVPSLQFKPREAGWNRIQPASISAGA